TSAQRAVLIRTTNAEDVSAFTIVVAIVLVSIFGKAVHGLNREAAHVRGLVADRIVNAAITTVNNGATSCGGQQRVRRVSSRTTERVHHARDVVTRGVLTTKA